MKNVDFVLVEDSATDAHMIERIVQKQAIADEYIWLRDGEEAVSYFETCNEKKPCLVLLDIKLPKISGFDVLQFVRKNEKTKHIPVVIYSSSKEEKDIESAYEYGANSYVPKPHSFGELKETLKQLTTYWLKVNKIN